MTPFFSPPCVRRRAFTNACPCSPPYISWSFYCCSQPVIGRKTFSHHAAWFNVCASLFPCSLGGGLTKYITTILTEKKETGCQARVEVEFYYMVLSSLAFPLRLQRKNMLSVTEAILKSVSQLDQQIPGQLLFELPMEVRPPWGVALGSSSKCRSCSLLMASPVTCRNCYWLLLLHKPVP